MMADASLRGQTYLPPPDAEALGRLEMQLARADVRLTVSAADTEDLPLPDELRGLLLDVVSALRRGRAITMAPLGLRLTTQQAADLLGVSRPTLVKLLTEGRIPYETPSRHRRIALADLLAYQETRRQERSRTLDELSAQAQESGLYELRPDAYDVALAEARRKLA